MTSQPFQDPLVLDPLYPDLQRHVIEATGLAYYADKGEDLARKIRRRLTCLGLPGCAAYIAVLRDSRRGPAEWDALIAAITIGETHFFRHREQFDALRDLVLPDLIERNRLHRRLRIWSAGCSMGAETYSLAILLKLDFTHQLAGWDVTILGTDINRHSLDEARRGSFDEYAFRATRDDLKRNCFRKEGKLWNIAPEFKEGVSFQYHNMVERSFPSLVNNLAFDLIVCRNVMIYFGQDLMRKMIQQFHGCLVPGGWFLVGPAEPNIAYFTSFDTVNAPGATLYRRRGEEAAEEDGNRFAQGAGAAAPWWPPPMLPLPANGSANRPAAAPHQASGRHQPTLAVVREQADRGEWEKSVHSCGELLGMDNLNATAHFYYALILEQMDRREEAEQSFRRAIYLDRQFILAHYHLGLSLQQRKDPRTARSFENALDLLDLQPEDGVLAEADGLTVAQLKQTVKMQIGLLRERQ